MTWYRKAQTDNKSLLTFRDQSIGSHHGQSDNTITAYNSSGVPVGRIEYSVYGDEVYVQYIHVNENERRKGIGRALLLELQKKYPDTGIELGMSTPDGSALIDKMNKTYVKNEEWEKLTNEKSILLDRKKVLDEMVEKWFNLPEKEQESTRQKILSYGDEFNNISDRLYDIEKELSDIMPGKTLLTT